MQRSALLGLCLLVFAVRCVFFQLVHVCIMLTSSSLVISACLQEQLLLVCMMASTMGNICA